MRQSRQTSRPGLSFEIEGLEFGLMTMAVKEMSIRIYIDYSFVTKST